PMLRVRWLARSCRPRPLRPRAATPHGAATATPPTRTAPSPCRPAATARRSASRNQPTTTRPDRRGRGRPLPRGPSSAGFMTTSAPPPLLDSTSKPSGSRPTTLHGGAVGPVGLVAIGAAEARRVRLAAGLVVALAVLVAY